VPSAQCITRLQFAGASFTTNTQASGTNGSYVPLIGDDLTATSDGLRGGQLWRSVLGELSPARPPPGGRPGARRWPHRGGASSSRLELCPVGPSYRGGVGQAVGPLAVMVGPQRRPCGGLERLSTGDPRAPGHDGGQVLGGEGGHLVGCSLPPVRSTHRATSSTAGAHLVNHGRRLAVGSRRRSGASVVASARRGSVPASLRRLRWAPSGGRGSIGLGCHRR
jgi:hypothetical protein